MESPLMKIFPTSINSLKSYRVVQASSPFLRATYLMVSQNNKLEPLFKLQKKCMRILFGDKEAYLNKFKTCARSRPLDNQILGQEFYSREHTKPLFNQHGIMNVRNLHIYHCSNEILKF